MARINPVLMHLLALGAFWHFSTDKQVYTVRAS